MTTPIRFLALTALCLASLTANAENSTITAQPSSQEVGEVNLGAPKPRPAPADNAQASTEAGLPQLGGGKPAVVYTTMEAASRAGVNPMAEPASAPASAPAAEPLKITDDTILGRLAALPFLFKVGALLLAGIAGFAAWEWKQRR